MLNTTSPDVPIFTRSRELLHADARATALRFPVNTSLRSYEKEAGELLAAKLDWERDIFHRIVATPAFEAAVANFVRSTFLKLTHLRPGDWEIRTTAEHEFVRVVDFPEYEHVKRVCAKAATDSDLRAVLGGDYLIAPDVVVLRTAEPDEVLNQPGAIVDAGSARLAPLRAANTQGPRVRFLHASLSCKWTLRSDRAQNARSEALNLLRNRKGHSPHIVAITAEPLPSRLSSLALGMSDLDCTYHIALQELQAAVEEVHPDQLDILQMLVEGRRLRDISDLPLDLAV